MIFDWDKYEINPRDVRGGKTFCPKCHDSRKHKSDRSLSVDIKTGMFRCHNHPCEYKGTALRRQPNEKKEYAKPLARIQKVSDPVVKWFETRGISNDTLLRANVTESWEWMPQRPDVKSDQVICFNYMRGGELVNIKFRDPYKNFKMNGGSELIFYNIDALDDEREGIVVEGEMDCLTNIECAVYNSVSVPNGASSSGNVKLEYLDNCWESFEGLTKIILATDDDEPGLALREELARRLGKHRCWKVHYPDGCKDMNEVLMKHGKQAVRDVYANATQFPVEGITTLEDEFDEVLDWYHKGPPQGLDVCIPGFDLKFDSQSGHLITVTGAPQSGKSEFVDLIMANMTRIHGWKWGVTAFETQPSSMHMALIAEKLIGKTVQFRHNKEHRMTEDEYHQALGMIDDHYFFVKVDEADLTIDGLLDKYRQLVLQKGIKGVVLDPWNYVESRQTGNQSETQYINECLTKIKVFCATYGVHFILVAHPTKLKKENGKFEIPTLYHISGSAHFFNKTDDGFTLWRDYETGIVDVHRQKVKRSWLGSLGRSSYRYNTFTRQYEYTEQA
jgi:twinkle protein